VKTLRPYRSSHILFVSLLLVSLFTPSARAAAVTVQEFSPQGIVKQPHQVTARFSAPMVPFGDLRDLAPPFVIDCPAKGSSRWIDATNWVYDFEKPVAGGVRCTFTLRDDLRSTSGSPAGGKRAFAFSTGGPAVISITPTPGEYEGIDEQQVFLLGLDADVDFAQAQGRIGFYVDGLPGRIEADKVEGADLDAILATLSSWSRPSPPILAIRARRTFPNDRKVRLQWSAGIRSTSGIATDKPQVFEFKTRSRFDVELSCTRENARAGCVPIKPIRLNFTAPISREAFDAIRLKGPDGSEQKPKPADDSDGEITTVIFPGPFSENAAYTVELPRDLRDDAGRVLEAPALVAKTGAMPVLAKFAAPFGIVERNAEPALPVTLRNIEQIVPGTRATAAAVADGTPPVTGVDVRVSADDPARILGWLRRLGAVSRHHSIFEFPKVAPAKTAPGAAPEPETRRLETAGEKTSFTLPKPLPSKETEVVGIPLERPGLHIVELASPMLGAALLSTGRTMYVAAGVLVTNLAVHFKYGRESSIAWVTTLDTASPVGGARVTVSDCNGKELASAETGADGVARFRMLPKQTDLPSCWNDGAAVEPQGEETDVSYDYTSSPAISGLDSGLLVVARTAGDMSFVHTSWGDGIEAWRFHVSGGEWSGGGPALRTVFDRPLYRQGETVHMKHVLRTRTIASGFEIPPADARSVKATIEHTASGQSYPIEVAFDDQGLAAGEWAVPAGATLGTYTVQFTAGSSVVESGTFRVEQFRVPLMHGDVIVPPTLPARPKSVDVDLSVRYLSGGAASGLPVVLRSELVPGAFTAPDDYEGFTFAAGPIEEAAQSDDCEEGDCDGEGSGEPVSRSLPKKELTLDAAGAGRVTLADLPAIDRPTDLVVEAEFRDPNGETVNVATTRTLMAASRVPGLRVEDWLDTGETLHPQVVVLTTDGKPSAGTPVRIEAASRRWLSHRKRLVGGFYDYDNTSETRRLGVLCEGRSDAQGRFRCEAKAPADGQVVLEAIVTDPEGNTATTHSEVWVGEESSGFENHAGDRIELVPEKRSYEPGETARLQVRMPFREATALVTTEREGVGLTQVVHLTGENPVVEVAIGGDEAPNIFISVLAVRGRVGDVQPTALLDLGRPAFKLGLTELTVDWKTHRLAVDVKSDRELYRTREKARVHVRVRDPEGRPPEAGSEVAIAAVDEGLLELSENRSWNLLDAMMSHRSCEVETSTAQGQVIGKRHFGKKALPTGGGGGNGSTRELFDTLLFWSPRVKLDAAGEADVEVPLNDSLTSFRIVAVATAGAGQFGKGSTTIRANRELSILSGLPPLARERDELGAEFTVRNTGQSPLVVRAFGSAEANGNAGKVDLPAQEVAVGPGESRVLVWPVKVPAGASELVYSMRASAAPAAEDLLTIRQRIIPREPVRVVQSTLAQLDGSISMPVRAPADADTGAAGSGIVVSAAASLAAGVAPLKDWLAHYRYSCLEQRVSIAIGREDDDAWQKIMGELGTYIDGDGLLGYFPGQTPGDDRLTAYVISIATAAGRKIPEELLTRMKDGLVGYVNGSVVRPSWLPLPDLSLRKLAAVEALARIGAADPAMLSTIAIQPELWPTSSVLDWWSILLHLPVGAGAAQLPAADSKRRAAERILRARLDLSGTTLVFTTEKDDAIWWMMAGPDSNAARLLLLVAERNLWKEDAPRILRGLVARRKDGALDTTVANAWAVLAMRTFEKTYESEPVAGRTTVALADQARAIEWSVPEPAPVTLPWPPAEATMAVAQQGSGKPWITTTSRAAVARTAPVAAGYRITKTVRAIDARTPGKWSRGDRMGIRLDIDAQRPMWWVVIEDPLPTGASHLASGLGRAAPPPQLSWSDWIQQMKDGVLWPRYVERSHESWRAYVEQMPDGHAFIEYAIRLNQAGSFHLPPTRVEALYAPEVFGEAPNTDLIVEP